LGKGLTEHFYDLFFDNSKRQFLKKWDSKNDWKSENLKIWKSETLDIRNFE